MSFNITLLASARLSCPYFSLRCSEITTKAPSFVVSSLLDSGTSSKSKFGWCLPATCLRAASQLNFGKLAQRTPPAVLINQLSVVSIAGERAGRSCKSVGCKLLIPSQPRVDSKITIILRVIRFSATKSDEIVWIQKSAPPSKMTSELFVSA